MEHTIGGGKGTSKHGSAFLVPSGVNRAGSFNKVETIAGRLLASGAGTNPTDRHDFFCCVYCGYCGAGIRVCDLRPELNAVRFSYAQKLLFEIQSQPFPYSCWGFTFGKKSLVLGL